MKKVFEYLKENPTFHIATIDGDQPRVRPFGAIAEFEGKLYIVTNNQKKCYKQMLENPKIEISAMGKENSWIRIEAKVIPDNRREAREQMLEQNSILSGMYTVDDGLMEVLYLEDATATFYSFTGQPEVIKF
ncbi:pyridoxamine 5'-phosphate oxidase family protein [Clostridium aminobutyricum]|uniref:Pyridoxamine 5'-phosphate oxidase family protein n=1 Tax=Clostridium aminobutyricum TaxID=33953 RepID=A0A939IJ87_CLOAM|nr:pyridoxamine 5'-phosphate oxidase family protein [Clostridium aminobutyricum]MBN7773353.1 pyridoxamine 5'-phosphate oxidase family protein [Clostridium aminobutyricum]